MEETQRFLNSFKLPSRKGSIQVTDIKKNSLEIERKKKNFKKFKIDKPKIMILLIYANNTI